MSRSIRSVFCVLWIFWLVAVVWGSLLPEADLLDYEARLPFLGWNDKLPHFGAYFGLAFLAIFSFLRRRVAITMALAMILVGVIIELGQHFSPGRTPDLVDAAVNAAGVITGLASALCFRKGSGTGRQLRDSV